VALDRGLAHDDPTDLDVRARGDKVVSDIVGLVLRDGHVDVVALRGHLGSRSLAAAFSVPADEEAPAQIKRQLLEAGVRARRAHVGLPRRAVVAKAVELPAVPGADLRRMVGFELERHLPFAPSDALFDFEMLDAGAGGAVRVLLVAVERRSQERLRQLLAAAGLTPGLVGIAIHSVARLEATDAAHGRIVLWLEAADAELAVVVRGRIVASRAFPLPADGDARGRALESELGRTLASLAETDRREVTEIVIGGVSPPTFAMEGLRIRVGIDDPPGLALGEGMSLPAVAVALERPGRKLPVANLLPDELRPRPFPWPVAATAALALFTLAIAAAIPAVAFVKERRALATLEANIARLAPQVQTAERLAVEVERARRELATLRSFEEQRLQPLPVLRELTDTLPADAWLTNFSIDRNGLELGGFANAASQLIPLLEASPALERVEFTSPVTKGRDREQFRLRASWEKRPGGR
jgi:Tfp pilus assembly protein PilN